MWDLFCSVIDNYGDIGVSWRLARVLRQDHGLPVRLWIDDLQAFARIEPGVDSGLTVQRCADVEVRAWTDPFPDVEPGEVVIEAFGCRLPESFLAAMARKARPPVWINLEYLSAEHWVRGCHGLPSPHPRLPLRKHFFFPGFGHGTGGLLCERGLAAERDAFQNDPRQRAAYWSQLGVPPAAGDELRVSLFCYDNAALPALLDAWAAGARPLTCLVPEGPILPRLARAFGQESAAAGSRFRRDALAVHVLPFTDQPGYDRLLWACDLNFVRGEDSFVRAQWAGRPLVWHIYPQAEGAHYVKLDAFLDRYCAHFSGEARTAVRGLHASWNAAPGAAPIAESWAKWASWTGASAHARAWAGMLESGPELATELVKFAQGPVK